MHEATNWWTQPNGLLAAELDGLRLIVRGPTEADSFARFMLLDRVSRDSDLFALTASGTAESLGEAMEAAERKAMSCTRIGSAEA
ncbi:hypothetical protein [Teichococcus oryzae]|uniref:Uncharacterized protein n=1 Tax=Teichococcus oryzae TaxID=1608942 RepID=A0A5B2TD47_9PROT|nr:hypothetical protein [Pseudoroseomonas oryzae]KAA2212003.1 hypothetical protein F0Q34_16930 [Pseudoroseomonas oryzae]